MQTTCLVRTKVKIFKDKVGVLVTCYLVLTLVLTCDQYRSNVAADWLC